MDSPMSKRSFKARVFGNTRSRLETVEAARPPTRLESYRTTLMNLDDYLPQPEEDRRIASKVYQLQGLIETHAVYDYYHDRAVSQSIPEIQSLLQKKLFKSDDEEVSRRLANNLLRTSHRMTFIRIVIARALLAAINLHGDPATSLLPKEIVLFMTAFKNTPRSKDNDQVDEVALCEWRRLGLYLLSSADNRVVQLQDTDLRVELMVDSLDEILCPFAEQNGGAGSGRRLGNLRSIVLMATDIGVLLFGQPCGWELDWRVRPTNDQQQDAVIPNGIQRINSQRSQQYQGAASIRSPTSHSDAQPQLPPEPRKRRKRLQQLMRSQSTKERDRERENLPKDRSRPPPAQSMMRLAQQTSGVSDAPLYRIRTGETETHYKSTQHPSSQPHYPQSYDTKGLAEQRGLRSLNQRSRSEPHFTPIYAQEATIHRNTWESPSPLRETHTEERKDAFFFNSGFEDNVASTVPYDKYNNSTPQSGQIILPERPRTGSRQIGPNESFLEGPDQPRFTQDQQHPNQPNRQLEQPRLTQDHQHPNQPNRHLESRFTHDQHHQNQPIRQLEKPKPNYESQVPTKPSRPIIYFPALLKVRDEYGCKLPQPLLVLEPVVDTSFKTPWY